MPATHRAISETCWLDLRTKHWHCPYEGRLFTGLGVLAETPSQETAGREVLAVCTGVGELRSVPVWGPMKK